jgi:hypothetical protein
MQSKKEQQWLVSACGGLLLAAACVALSIWGLESAGMIFLPGALLAGLIFPQGVHGDSVVLYIALTFVLTATFTPFVFLAQYWWLRRKQAQGR